FILCAFVPFAVIATLSYFQLRELHLQSGQQRLAVGSKQYGMGVYERLLSAAEIARNAADFPDETARVRKLAQPRLRSLGCIDAKGHAHPLLGSTGAPAALDGHALARLAQGKPLVQVDPREGAARVLLLLPAAPSGSLLVGEIDPE